MKEKYQELYRKLCLRLKHPNIVTEQNAYVDAWMKEVMHVELLSQVLESRPISQSWPSIEEISLAYAQEKWKQTIGPRAHDSPVSKRAQLQKMIEGNADSGDRYMMLGAEMFKKATDLKGKSFLPTFASDPEKSLKDKKIRYDEMLSRFYSIQKEFEKTSAMVVPYQQGKLTLYKTVPGACLRRYPDHVEVDEAFVKMEEDHVLKVFYEQRRAYQQTASWLNAALIDIGEYTKEEALEGFFTPRKDLLPMPIEQVESAPARLESQETSAPLSLDF